MKESIGLVGIGLAGTALAEHLLSAGFDVVGYDIEPSKRRHLEELGGTAAQGPADVARRCRRVVLSLMTTDIVCQVIEGPGGLLEADPPPTHILDATTGDPEKSAALAHRLAQRSVHYLDATISGSSQQIRDRQGVFMVGGEKTAFQACRDLLEAVTDKVFHVGPSGSGAKTKLAVNLISGLHRLALAEGLAFAERLGLDLPAFLDLLGHTAIASDLIEAKGPKMVQGDFTPPQARLAQHRKDVSIILEYARRGDLSLPLSRTHLEVLDSAIAAGDGDLDNAAVIREIRRRHPAP